MERRSLQKTKTKLITNSLIELGVEEDEGKGKGRYFVSKFIEAGLAHYKELGDIVITKETLDKFIQTMVGCPVIIDHEDVNDKNVEELRVGVISRVWYNEMDGWYYCEGIITDNEAINLIKNEGWSVSCAYNFVSDDTKKTYHGKPIDMEFIDGEFLHLAIVKEPRYEGANIVINSKENFEKEHPRNKIGEFIKKLNEKGYPAKEEDFIVREGKSEYTYTNGTEDRRPLVKDNKAYMFPEHELKHYAHEYGHLFAQRNKEYFDLFKNQVGDLDKFIDDNYDKLKELDSAIDNYEELFAEAVSWDIRNIEMEQSKIIRKIFNLDKINNSVDKENIVMSVLNDLTDFIKNVVSNEKEDEMKVKNEDKRKLIDEIGGILKDKVDDEIIRTVIKKAEELSYEPSEDDKADNKKAENEEDKDEAKNKCKNEDDKKEDKKVEDEEEKEEDITKNEDEEKEEKDDKKEVKNSMKDFVMGGKGQYEEKSIYTSRAKRLEEGNKY